jgi:hypothetical protein
VVLGGSVGRGFPSTLPVARRLHVHRARLDNPRPRRRFAVRERTDVFMSEEVAAVRGGSASVVYAVVVS